MSFGQKTVEALWQYANHGDRLFIDVEHAAHNIAARAEMLLPICIAQERLISIGSAAWHIILVAECPSHQGLQFENLKCVARRERSLHAGHGAVRLHGK